MSDRKNTVYKPTRRGYSVGSMNHSFYCADRTTHLKIVVIALAAGIALAGVAISSRVNSSSESAGVIRAGQPAAMTGSTLTQMRG
jgi:hypothetical protein